MPVTRSLSVVAASLLGCTMLFGQPVNDSCSNVVPDTLLVGTSILFTGDNTGATPNGDAVPGTSMDDGFGKVWHAFVLTSCATVTVSYCGNVPVFSTIYSVLVTSCPADDPAIFFTSQDDAICGDNNWTLFYQTLAAGTYYIPVFSGFGLVGPYQIGVSASPCGGGPPNDGCTGAYNLPVHDSQDCPAASAVGNDAFGTPSAPGPGCMAGTTVQDVWYTFNSGADTALVLDTETGTATSLGIEVKQGCGGAVIACGYSPQTSFPLAVTAFTSYVVRVFTAVDTSTAGTFGLCLHRLPPECDGGQVTTTAQEQEVTICQDGLPDPIGLLTTSASSEDYVFVLCTQGDTIAGFLSGNTIDPDTLAVGIHHVFGFSYNGDIDDDTLVGYPVSVLFAHGGCFDLSDDSVVVNVEICSGIQEEAIGWTIHPIPSDGELIVSSREGMGEVMLELIDMSGRCLYRERIDLGPGEQYQLKPAVRLAPGAYALRMTGARGGSMRRCVIR